MDNYCNNCGKNGHMYHQCKMPIISVGVIVFKRDIDSNLRFLMIRRKDTLGFMDFMRGKYSIYNKDYIMNLLKEMTLEEKENLKTKEFQELWNQLWNKNIISEQYRNEQQTSSEKFKALTSGILIHNDFYTLEMLINESNKSSQWMEPEWGFPKGRRNFHEKDIDCALREFCEETGYSNKYLKNIDNILPFEEIFTGSNYKSYKHKYYLMMMTMDILKVHDYDKNEVSKMEWKTYEDCVNSIRSYNLEKKRIIENVYNCLTQYKITNL